MVSKLQSMPSGYSIRRLIKRDAEYSDKIDLLKKSILSLNSENTIKKHFHNLWVSLSYVEKLSCRLKVCVLIFALRSGQLILSLIKY
ncbi:hypothetical protein BH18THE2_BH18THE2_30230 [soil metagenome]